MKPVAKCLGLIANLNELLLGVYTNTINTEVQREFSGNHSADIRVCCVDSARSDELLNEDDADGVTGLLVEYGRGLMLAGADGLVLCGSKLNPFAAEVRRALKVPVIDMAFAVATALRDQDHRCVGVVSPCSRIEESWWRENLPNISVFPPSSIEREWLNDRLADALAGQKPESRLAFDAGGIALGLCSSGVTAVVLTSPVFDRWIRIDEFLLDTYDASAIHAWAAALWALHSGSDLRSAPHCVFA